MWYEQWWVLVGLAGLAIDAIGAVILAWDLMIRQQLGASGALLSAAPPDHPEQQRRDRVKRWARVAAVLLVFGFALQGVALVGAAS